MSHSRYATALGTYNHAIDDVSKRIMQDRALHMQNLNELYIQSLSNNMHGGYVDMVESAIGERSTYNSRKLIHDAADLTMQDRKLNSALQNNRNVLSGGGVVDNSRQALGAMDYSTKRSNALYANFNKKLAQDRKIHMQELKALYSATPTNTACKSVLSSMLTARQQNNASRTHHDANMWAQTDQNVMQALGGGAIAHDVLNYGISQTYNTPRMTGGSHNTGSLPLHNQEAAELWGDILNGGGHRY